jgi:FSR family fosmidomycin resistance protein-like MFS transporter
MLLGMATEAAERRASGELDGRGMTVLALAHLFDDVNQSGLPALLPFLIAERGLSYTAAAGLVLFASLSSSIVQPAIGALADRRSMPWLIALGLFLAGGGLALAGAMPNYWLTVVCVLVSGLGVALFHPEAARFANFVAGRQKAIGMRWFAVGGNLGFALGPLLLTPLLLLFGLRGSLVLLVPAVAMAVVVVRELPRLQAFVPAKRVAVAGSGEERWGPFAHLTVAVSVRAMAYIGMVSFTPLFFIGVLHASKTVGNAALTIILLAGAAGTIYGGRLADSIGCKRTLVLTTSAAVPLLGAFLAVTARFPNVPLAIALLALATFPVVASQTAFVVLGQEYLPRHIGVASGVTLGLAISLGGVATPFLGHLADDYGLPAAFEAIVGLLFVSAVLSALLPGRAADARHAQSVRANLGDAVA